MQDETVFTADFTQFSTGRENDGEMTTGYEEEELNVKDQPWSNTPLRNTSYISPSSRYHAEGSMFDLGVSDSAPHGEGSEDIFPNSRSDAMSGFDDKVPLDSYHDPFGQEVQGEPSLEPSSSFPGTSPGTCLETYASGDGSAPLKQDPGAWIRAEHRFEFGFAADASPMTGAHQSSIQAVSLADAQSDDVHVTPSMLWSSETAPTPPIARAEAHSEKKRSVTTSKRASDPVARTASDSSKIVKPRPKSSFKTYTDEDSMGAAAARLKTRADTFRDKVSVPWSSHFNSKDEDKEYTKNGREAVSSIVINTENRGYLSSLCNSWRDIADPLTTRVEDVPGGEEIKISTIDPDHMLVQSRDTMGRWTGIFGMPCTDHLEEKRYPVFKCQLQESLTGSGMEATGPCDRAAVELNNKLKLPGQNVPALSCATHGDNNRRMNAAAAERRRENQREKGMRAKRRS
ncbi:hypothetical protein IAT40_003216 [Kwoniella sp. CBS 6097]